MKNRILGLGAALLLTLGVAVGFSQPASADFVPDSTSHAVCVWGDIYTGFHLEDWRTIHYGTAHVTQCGYLYQTSSGYFVVCRQYVWNVPSPGWQDYSPPFQSPPWCW